MRARYDRGVRPARVIRRTLITVAIATVIVACTLGGMAVALRAASDERQEMALGTVETSVVPALDGHVSVYVPIVDWRVRLLDHAAPVNVTLELRGIDRDQAGAGISSADAASRSLDVLRRDSRAVIERAIERAVVVATIGGLAGAFAAGALLTSTRLRRRWLVVGPVVGAVLVAGVIVPSVAALRALDAEIGRAHV